MNEPGLDSQESRLYDELLHKRNCSPAEIQVYFVLRAKINNALQARALPPKPQLTGYALIAAESLSQCVTWKPPDAEPPGDSALAYSRHHYRANIGN